jgi:hypothetical protein
MVSIRCIIGYLKKKKKKRDIHGDNLLTSKGNRKINKCKADLEGQSLKRECAVIMNNTVWVSPSVS